MKTFLIVILLAVFCSGCMSDKKFCKKLVSGLFTDLNYNRAYELDDAKPKRAVNVGVFYIDF